MGGGRERNGDDRFEAGPVLGSEAESGSTDALNAGRLLAERIEIAVDKKREVAVPLATSRSAFFKYPTGR